MKQTTRRDFLGMAGAAAIGAGATFRARPTAADGGATQRPPNIVVIFADDLGYGDLGCYGHPTIETPNLDRMASEGMKLTQFYSAASVCTPSRAGLVTGRLPIRNGMCSNPRRVLFPNSGGGLPETEITIAQMLGDAGYATGCVGKWHLGHRREFLPTRHGFDEYYGIPYSNDMKPCPILDGEDVIEEPADQTTLTRRYAERATSFIRRNRDNPFFLYFPHSFPHIPLFASDRFLDTSRRGLFGDVVEELDWSIGEVLNTLRDEGLEEDTLVVFTSDNGPWLTTKLRGGSAGLLRGGKGSTWEGGMREPCVAWWPGVIAPGSHEEGMASTLDLLPTCAAAAGIAPPEDRTLDGMNMLPLLNGTGTSARTSMPFYRGTRLMAYRSGAWKAHFITQAGYGGGPTEHDPPALYQVEHDPSEKWDVAADHADVLEGIAAEVEVHQATLEPVASQLEVPLPEGVEPGAID